ncbi:shikimate dehydrogenase [Leptolyngbya sp. NIES-2104]|uniref:shikimate dehydrogenase n=1 Tax=Leptolyngbya sp. NIES-2104 TaxID=1552121 RepID=UPI0006ECCBB4|nr:shikimate dehydrogenase [Leptolyngbya sp. NIES-2104]GAP97508.1 shikimate 5-dehydrogenase I alpha [Leptolyngbya sp. NIES-2104]
MNRITGKTKLLGVIGDPIEHSLSPIMHNAAIAQMQIDFAYVPFHIRPEDLNTAIAGFRAIDLRGFSVTIPHKQTIMPLLSEITDVARAIGAVNTVWNSDRGWCGTNTDIVGFMAPIRERDWKSSIALILGNGGAARAVVAGCNQLGFAEIHVVGRNAEKIQEFARSWSLDSLSVHTWEQLSEFLPRADLVVNTTPIGMSPNSDQSPLTEEQANLIKPNAIAYDLIYVPNPTKFLQQAQQREIEAIDGLEMLVQQGAAALEIWTEQTVPDVVMRRSLRVHLGFE